MKRFLVLLIALTPMVPALEREEPEEGHSYHGEVFNEGPRQAAVMIEGTGEVSFPVTVASETAQAFFDQGIGQLHGYWDFEAERSFRQVASIEPDCAMAYWGMAMANFKNTSRARGFIGEAVKRRDHAGEKEWLWIDGLAAYFQNTEADDKVRRRALAESLRGIVEKYPGDIEAKAFLMRQLYQNSRKGVPFESHEAVNAIAEEIFEVDPDHPAHHYVIHLWDRKTASRALESSVACGPAAPAIAHMWHMPGHIYSKLHRYSEAAWYQEASARVDHAHTIKFQFLPDQIHNFRHNNAWLVKTLSHLGRCRDAVRLAKNMVELPRYPKFGKPGEDSSYNPSGSSWQHGRQRLRDTLFLHEQWAELLSLENTPYLIPDEKTLKRIDLQRIMAIARLESGDPDGGKKRLTRLEKELAEEKGKAKKSTGRIGELEAAIAEISIYAALQEEPPAMDRVRELLSRAKKIPKARQASLWSRIGDHEKAVKLAGEAVKAEKNQVHPLAIQVEVLQAAGKTAEAGAAFELLRTVGGEADLDLPVLERLASLAGEFGFPADWRISTPKPAGWNLESLGPFRWSAPPAPDFALRNADGEEFRLSDRAGKNTLVIFYLGKGCAHCMEQLNEFAPVMTKFQEEGIDIVAVSSDTAEGLAETFATTGDGEGKNPFPFPLLSDADLETFRNYRAYDDFENQALHGTFLIDGSLRIRWQDISYEPFMYADWLLGECVRLLGVES